MTFATLARRSLRLPAHVLNGITVGIGIGLLQVLFGAAFGPHLAALAVSGAVYSSLADIPEIPARSWRRVLSAGAGGTLAALAISLLMPYPLWLGLGIALIAFVAMMMMAWGPRAGAVSFAPILAIVFTMGQPPGHDTWQLVGWHAAGAWAYLLWSLGVVSLLQRRYRRLVLANALAAMARLMRSRAALLDAAGGGDGPAERMKDWVLNEAALADRLQTARDLLFPASDKPLAGREIALLLHALELRDLLLASQLDTNLLGQDDAGRQVCRALGERLRLMAGEVEGVRNELLGAALPAAPAPRVTATLGTLFGRINLLPGDARARLLPALVNRVLHMERELEQMHAVLRSAAPVQPFSTDELAQFVGPTGWPLAALRPHATLKSPVLRHALRAALALSAAYCIALALPWASHPQWLVLSVAVVLRGNLGQTLARRNTRVLGTLAGCLLVMVLAHVPSQAVMSIVFLLAVSLAHAFAVERYFVTAVAATVMALLQAHLAHPGTGFPIAERVADTVLGALLAWAFSYVLPWWERRSLPQTVQRCIQALHDYAGHSLGSLGAASTVDQRLARRRAYDALSALAAALQRSAAEPAKVRPPVQELTVLLDHGQRLMAHVSVLRLMRARHPAELDRPEASAALAQARDGLGAALDTSPESDHGACIAAPSVALVPDEPPTQAVLPWLLWRLQIAMHDAHLTGHAARRALAMLAAR